MNGPEILAALQREIKDMNPGDSLEINQTDLRILANLKPDELGAISQHDAERICSDLRDGNTKSLGELLGVKIRIDPNATAMN